MAENDGGVGILPASTHPAPGGGGPYPPPLHLSQARHTSGFLALILSLLLVPGTDAIAADRVVLIVCSHPGTDEYQKPIAESADLWAEISREGGTEPALLGRAGGARLEEVGTALAETSPDAELWLVLLGHGSFDGKRARFNLRDEDLTDRALAEHLEGRTGTTVVLNTTAASAPFLATLSGENRVILTATKSGEQANLTRLGRHLAETFRSPTADRDQDGQVSLLEAFLGGAAAVTEDYETEGFLATEHALLDDNGDGQGTRSEWFVGLDPQHKPKGAKRTDGQRAHQLHLLPSELERRLTPEQRTRRDELETQVHALRARRKDLAEEVYYNKLESILLQLSEIYLPAKPEQDEEEPGSGPEPEEEVRPAQRITPSEAETPEGACN